MVPEFFWDKYVKKIQPMTQEGPVIMFFKEVSHSIFLWVVAYWLWALFYPTGVVQNFGIVFLLCGFFAGVIPDIFTHTEERFLETDPTFIFPFSHLFGFRLRWHKPEWEYRKAHGDLSMKEWEINFNNWVFMSFLALLVVYCISQLIMYFCLIK